MKPREMHERFTKANGIRIRYLDWPGSGPPIVLLHNNRGAADPWKRFVEVSPLPNRFVAPDQRGCGSTDKPATDYSVWDLADDVAGLIDALDLGPVPIVGCAIGASIGLATAADHPDKVTSLVMLDSGFPIDQSVIDWSVGILKDTPQDFASKDEAKRYVRTLPDSLGYSWSPIWEEYFEWTFEEKPDGRWAFRYDKNAMIQATSHLADNLWDDVDKVECPVLVAVADFDGIVDDSGARKLANRLKNGTFVGLENTRHLVFLEGNLEPIERMTRKYLEAHDPTMSRGA